MKTTRTTANSRSLQPSPGPAADRRFAFLTLAAALLTVLLVPTTSRAQMREFTSTDGRTITAELVGGSGDQVTLRFENGNEVNSEISVFSEADREYIAAWLEEQAATMAYSFNLRYEKTKEGERKRNTNSHEITVEQWRYDMTLENRNRVDLSDLELRYRIFVISEHEKGRNEKGLYIADGMVDVPRVVQNGRATPQTRTVPLTTSKLKPDYEYKDGSRDRLTDELAGIWVKVFHEGRMIWEFKSPHKAVNEGTFTDEEALAIGDSSGER